MRKPKCFQVLMLQDQVNEILTAPASWGGDGGPPSQLPPLPALGDSHTFLLSVLSRWPGPRNLTSMPPSSVPTFRAWPACQPRDAGQLRCWDPLAQRVRQPSAWSPDLLFPPPLPPQSRNWGVSDVIIRALVSGPGFTMEQKQAGL